MARKIRVKAVSREKDEVFDIYLDTGAGPEWLMAHRPQPFLYELLRDGAEVEELRRLDAFRFCGSCLGRNRNGLGHVWRLESHGRNGLRRMSEKLDRTVRHLVAVVDDELKWNASAV